MRLIDIVSVSSRAPTKRFFALSRTRRREEFESGGRSQRAIRSASGSHGDLIKRKTMVWRRKGKAGVVGRPQVARTKKEKRIPYRTREKQQKREREESEPGDARRGERREIEKETCLGSWVATKEESGRDGQTDAWGRTFTTAPSSWRQWWQVPAAAPASAGLQRFQGHSCMGARGPLNASPPAVFFFLLLQSVLAKTDMPIGKDIG